MKFIIAYLPLLLCFAVWGIYFRVLGFRVREFFASIVPRRTPFGPLPATQQSRHQTIPRRRFFLVQLWLLLLLNISLSIWALAVLNQNYRYPFCNFSWIFYILVSSSFLIPLLSIFSRHRFPYDRKMNVFYYTVLVLFCLLLSSVFMGYFKSDILVFSWKKLETVRISAGNQLSGRFHVIEKITHILENQGFQVELDPQSDGTFSTIDHLEDGTYNIGIVQGDIPIRKPRKMGDGASLDPYRRPNRRRNPHGINKIAAIFKEPLHIFARKGSGIRQLSDLRAHHLINPSVERSGTRDLALRLLLHYDLAEYIASGAPENPHQGMLSNGKRVRSLPRLSNYSYDFMWVASDSLLNPAQDLREDKLYHPEEPLRPENLHHPEEQLLPDSLSSTSRLAQTKSSLTPDLIFMVSALSAQPSPLASRILHSGAYDLIPIDMEAGFIERNVLNDSLYIPEGVYGSRIQSDSVLFFPSAPVRTVSAKASLVANSTVPEEITDQILRILYDYPFQQSSPIRLAPITAPENYILEQRLVSSENRLNHVEMIGYFLTVFISIGLFFFNLQSSKMTAEDQKIQQYMDLLAAIGKERIESRKWAITQLTSTNLTLSALESLLDYYENSPQDFQPYHLIGLGCEVATATVDQEKVQRLTLDLGQQLNFMDIFDQATEVASLRKDRTVDAVIKEVGAYARCFFTSGLNSPGPRTALDPEKAVLEGTASIIRSILCFTTHRDAFAAVDVAPPWISLKDEQLKAELFRPQPYQEEMEVLPGAKILGEGAQAMYIPHYNARTIHYFEIRQMLTIVVRWMDVINVFKESEGARTWLRLVLTEVIPIAIGNRREQFQESLNQLLQNPEFSGVTGLKFMEELLIELEIQSETGQSPS